MKQNRTKSNQKFCACDAMSLVEIITVAQAFIERYEDL